MEDTLEVGKKLVDLCRQQKNVESVKTLYSPEAVSVEPQGGPEMPAVMNGIEAIRGKNEWWVSNNEVHSANIKGPFPHGDRFAVFFEYDFTTKAGPMAGKRTHMEEVGLYTVKSGRIVREEFFYKMM